MPVDYSNTIRNLESKLKRQQASVDESLEQLKIFYELQAKGKTTSGEAKAR